MESILSPGVVRLILIGRPISIHFADPSHHDGRRPAALCRHCLEFAPTVYLRTYFRNLTSIKGKMVKGLSGSVFISKRWTFYEGLARLATHHLDLTCNERTFSHSYF